MRPIRKRLVGQWFCDNRVCGTLGQKLVCTTNRQCAERCGVLNDALVAIHTDSGMVADTPLAAKPHDAPDLRAEEPRTWPDHGRVEIKRFYQRKELNMESCDIHKYRSHK